MWSLGLLLLSAALASGFSIIGSGEPSEAVLWPTEYYLKGTKIDLSIGNTELFEVWYSGELNNSRISYFDGTVSIYYYGETDDRFGYMVKVYPKTSEDLENYITCEEESSEGPAKDFLPVADFLIYSGEIQYDKRTVSVWKQHDTSDEDSVMDKLLYVYRDPVGNVDIPVRYEVKEYNTWTKALTTHVIVEYSNFKIPNSSDLDSTTVEACEKWNVGIDLEKALRSYRPDSRSGLKKAFHAYKQYHKRRYDEEEHKMRLKIFKKNWRKVIEHNKKNLPYKMTINKFSDRTPEELRYLTATRPNPLGQGSMVFPHTEEELESMVQELPENYNMKLDGYITRVKNQGSCGSCWAFSTTAAVEGALSRANGGRNMDLSEQSVVDCAWGFDNYGCDGGLLDRAFKYILDYGIPTEREYGSYLGQDGKCGERNMSKVFNIKGFARVPPLSTNAMKVALYKYGPVAVAIYASEDLTKYSSGIFFDPGCEKKKHINHGVTVVGYGVRDGNLYWIVKNSWGEEWGQDGYVYMSATNDNCLLLTEAYYPIV